VLHVMPPLVVEEEEIARFVSALGALLERGNLRTLASFAIGTVRDHWS